MTASEARRLGTGEARFALEAIRAVKGPGSLPGCTEDHLRGFLARPENILIVASREGDPLGFLLAYRLDRFDGRGPMVCLYEIEVSENRRRQGAARAMFAVLERQCRDRGVGKIWTLTSRSNLPAMGFFENVGASLDPEVDDVLFTRRLTPEGSHGLGS